LTGKEEKSLQKDISNILDYVGQVSAVNAQGETLTPGPAEISPLSPRNVMRADEPYKAGAMMLGKREALLKAFPRREGDFDVVRKIIQRTNSMAALNELTIVEAGKKNASGGNHRR